VAISPTAIERTNMRRQLFIFPLPDGPRIKAEEITGRASYASAPHDAHIEVMDTSNLSRAERRREFQARMRVAESQRDAAIEELQAIH
jgi:hypothetical protein